MYVYICIYMYVSLGLYKYIRTKYVCVYVRVCVFYIIVILWSNEYVSFEYFELKGERTAAGHVLKGIGGCQQQ